MTYMDVLDRGYVELTNIAGHENYSHFDRLPARFARMSDENRGAEADLKLMRYMAKHQHTTPFESVVTWWKVKAPIFVARQFMRHRCATINELSRRYETDDVDVYIPTEWRGKSATRKQGSDGLVTEQEWCSEHYKEAICEATHAYERLLALGVAPEMARMALPQATYTTWRWKLDFHNLIHLLKLRTAEDTQWETRQYAKAMHELLQGEDALLLEAFNLG